MGLSGWTAADDGLLGERYGRVRTPEHGGVLGRSPGATKQRARRLGLDFGRYYSEAEITTVRDLYLETTAEEISERLYGTRDKINRVRKLAEKLGLSKWPRWSQAVLDRVRELHAEGLGDGEIARRMVAALVAALVSGEGRGDERRLQVRHIRLRLGLAANLDTAPAREAKKQAVRRQFASMGIDNPNELRQRAHTRFAESYGLPSDLCPAQVRIVLALLAGPLTLAEIKSAIGARPESQLLHNGRKTTYQADLVRRGLLARAPTGTVAGGRYRFLLTAACLDLLAAAPTQESSHVRESQA